MSDDEFDETEHDKLLASILGREEQVSIKKSSKKITSDLLINSVKHAKTAASLAKEKLELEKKEEKKVGASQTVAVPVHRQASERIRGAVGFIELKKDLKIWDNVVKSNRLADQLCFPLGEEAMLATEKPADRAEAFKPRTEFEKKMFNMWSGSKNNMTNDTVYTEAELEIIRAMDIKEAREKLNQMQKMRALISYREAKYRYAAKIKSKRYHRILKRQKRKQLIKEFDELLIRDPEAAKEKLKELENQRIIERASLKHRARTKFQQDVVKYAGRDARAKHVLEEHLRLGRELKSKVSMESSDEEEDKDEDKKESSKMSVSEMIKSAAVAAAKSSGTVKCESVEEANDARIALFELRARKRCELEVARNRGAGKLTEPVFEQDNDWTIKNTSKNSPKEESGDASFDEKRTNKSRDDQLGSKGRECEIKEEGLEIGTSISSDSKTAKKKVKKKRKKTLNEAKSKDCTTEDIDVLFNAAEEKIVENLKKVAQEMRDHENEDEITQKRQKTMVNPLKTNAKEKKNEAVDISLDPKNFLQVETANLSKVSSELMDRLDEFDEDQAHIVAEAFKDDDVIGDFEEDKEFIEEGERPKDVDLTLPGWGCWVGPGITERKRRKRFIIKAKQKRRKDQGKPGVIIKELEEPSISRLQPAELPFPYTSVVDFETMVSQPIGKDWNTIGTTHELCKPAVVTQGGRPIRPINKTDIIAGKLSLD